MTQNKILLSILSWLLLVADGGSLWAQAPRVLQPKQLPHDRRLGALQDLNGYFPFTPPETREAWERRAADLRRRILVSTGLWPQPPKTPLNARLFGRIERDGFTVEKVNRKSLFEPGCCANDEAPEKG